MALCQSGDKVQPAIWAAASDPSRTGAVIRSFANYSYVLEPAFYTRSRCSIWVAAANPNPCTPKLREPSQNPVSVAKRLLYRTPRQPIVSCRSWQAAVYCPYLGDCFISTGRHGPSINLRLPQIPMRPGEGLWCNNRADLDHMTWIAPGRRSMVKFYQNVVISVARKRS